MMIPSHQHSFQLFPCKLHLHKSNYETKIMNFEKNRFSGFFWIENFFVLVDKVSNPEYGHDLLYCMPYIALACQYSCHLKVSTIMILAID